MWGECAQGLNPRTLLWQQTFCCSFPETGRWRTPASCLHNSPVWPEILWFLLCYFSPSTKKYPYSKFPGAAPILGNSFPTEIEGEGVAP